jgi:hypothetical protein
MSGCRSRQDLTFQYPCSLRFPLLAGGNRTGARLGSPREAGGNLQEGGNYELWLSDWYNFPVHGGGISDPSLRAGRAGGVC